MILKLVNIFHVLLAVAMIGLILLQRGAGAAAGSGFGAGASGTVFGARGASNFLSKATKWLAVLFFALSLGMAIYASRTANRPVTDDLGVMGTAVPAEVAAPDVDDVPAAPATDAPAAATGDVPQAPVVDVEQAPEAPAPTSKDNDKN